MLPPYASTARQESSALSGRLWGTPSPRMLSRSVVRSQGGIQAPLAHFWVALKPNPLHLVLSEPLLRPIVELGRARALVRGHFLRVIERTAVGEVGGDPCCAKRVAADRRHDAGRRGAAADHAPGVGLVHGE